jgi:hypothetical protein
MPPTQIRPEPTTKRNSLPPAGANIGPEQGVADDNDAGDEAAEREPS